MYCPDPADGVYVQEVLLVWPTGMSKMVCGSRYSRRPLGFSTPAYTLTVPIALPTFLMETARVVGLPCDTVEGLTDTPTMSKFHTPSEVHHLADAGVGTKVANPTSRTSAIRRRVMAINPIFVSPF